MTNTTPAKNPSNSTDPAPNRIQRNLDQMTAAFPECPLCKTGAKYKIAGMFKNIAVCENCGAGWTSHEFYGDSQLLTLSLAKKGTYQELKPLLNEIRSIEFWKHLDLTDLASDPIENLLKLFAVSKDERRTEAKQKLENAGLIGEIEIRDIARGIQPCENRAAALIYLISQKKESDLTLLGEVIFDDEGKYTRTLVDHFFSLATEAGLPLAIPPIIRVLEESENPDMRAHAAEVLGEIQGDPRVIEALARALADRGRLSQEQIMAGSMEGFLVAAAKSKPHQIVREFALGSLIKIGNSAAAEALVDFELEEGFGSSIEKEAENLRPFGKAAIDLLIKNLGDENERRRARAAGFLCFLGNEDAVDPLIGSLSDDIVLVRSNAAYALGEIGDPRAVEPLGELQEDPEEKVQQAAAMALKKLNAF